MKNLTLYISIITLSAITLLNFNCKNDVPEPGYPVYDYMEPINNPPDIFQVMYNISYFGDRFALITFKDDAVWLIQKQGDSRIMFWATSDSTSLFIESADTLGLKGGTTYVFGANNNNYEEFNNFFAQFNKLEIDYSAFEPKF